MNKKTRYIIALILILVICWFGYIYTEEINKVAYVHKPFKQQLLRLLWLCIVGFLTWWAFLTDKKKWKSKVVGIIYFLVVVIFGILGLLEWKYKIFGESFKELISGVRLFLSSPLPFLFLWLLSSVNLENLKKH